MLYYTFSGREKIIGLGHIAILDYEKTFGLSNMFGEIWLVGHFGVIVC